MRRHFLLIMVLTFVAGLAGTGLPGPSVVRADGFIDFEDGVDGQPIQSSIAGLEFTTTQGYDWVYGDWRTGDYNGPYPSGAYYSNGNFFAWLGPNQGAGRIDFTETCATYLQVWVSSAYGLVADAYYSDGTLAGTASVPANLNTGLMERLRVDAPPGDCFSYVILHDTGNYWLIDDLTTDAGGVPNTRPPVIILPGLTGSYLWNDDTCQNDHYEVWPDVSSMLLQPFDQYLEHLRLAENGTDPASPCDHIYPSGIIRDITAGPLHLDFYGPLIDYLELVGFRVYSFDYDWRLDLRDTADELDVFVDSVLAETGADQVNFVDHSLGGLLARHYVTSDSDRAGKVEQVISLGTPFLGAPKSLKALRWGDPGMDILWGLIGLYSPRTRDLVQNSPAAYQILPTHRYFDVYGGGYYRVDGQVQNWNQTRYVLFDEHNADLALAAEDFHTDAMDDWGSTPLDVAFRVIVGSGKEDTPGMLHERTLIDWGGNRIITWDLEPTNGDGTVSLHSADLKGNGHDYSGGAPTWYTNDLDHGELIKEPYVMQFVGSILATPPTSEPKSRDDAGRQPLDPSVPALYLGAPDRFPEPRHHESVPLAPLAMSDLPFELDGGQIGAFGNVTLNVYDELGNHTGPIEGDRVELGIPGSGYTVLGDATFVSVPAGNVYTVETTSNGTDFFDLRVRNLYGLDSDLIQRTTVYAGVQIGPEGLAFLAYDPHNQGPASELFLDTDGDGTVDDSLPPTGDLGPGDSYDMTAPVVTIALQGEMTSYGWYVGEVEVTLGATDSGTGVASLEYSTDSGQTIEEYIAPFAVQAEQVSLLVAQATDLAGNRGAATAHIGPFTQYAPLVVKSSGSSIPVWTTGIGLDSQPTYALAIDPTNCNTLYAGTNAGLFKSTDRGQSWMPTGPNRILLVPQGGPAFERGAVSSTLVTSLAIEPSNGQIIYAGTWGLGVYRSLDGGGSWSPVNNGLGSNTWIYALTFNANGRALYAGSAEGGVFKTTDGAASWTAVNAGLDNLNIRSLAADPSASQVIYAGTIDGVFKTANGGASWSAMNNGLGTPTVWSFTVNPSDSQIVYAGLEDGGVFKTTNGGSAWTVAGNGLGSPTVYGLALNQADLEEVYAGTYGQGVYRSSDSAGSWLPINAGLGNLTVLALQMDGAACHTLHAGTGDGVWEYQP